MNILAIDPGHTQSAYVNFDVAARRLDSFGKCPNAELLDAVRGHRAGSADHLVIEQVACMGMAVGAEVFETVFWSGRFAQAWSCQGRPWSRVKRHEVKMHLCGNMRAKDPNIRQALIDMFSDGRGKEVAVGRKAAPGPLFGVSADVWAALAVAVTWAGRNLPASARLPAAPAAPLFAGANGGGAT